MRLYLFMGENEPLLRAPLSTPRFFWSVAPLGLCLRIGVIALVGAIAHWIHATMPWGMGSV
jgi:hypothetical protein